MSSPGALRVAMALGAASGVLVAARSIRRRVHPEETSAWTAIDWASHLGEIEHRGIRVRYCDYGEGPVLVLLHGMACSWEWWLECLPELGKHFRVLAVDLPGFGASDPLPGPAEIEEYAEAVAACLDALAVRRAAVAGHSMGGLVAIALAQLEPATVARLVLIGSGGVPMSDRHLAWVLGLLRMAHRAMTRPPIIRLIATSRTARRLLLRGAMRDPGAMSADLAALIAPRLDAPAFTDAIRASANAVRASAPERIEVPTALIWGELDPFAPVHTAHAMFELLREASIDVLPGIGHSPMVEAPDAFTDLLVRRADFTLPLHATTTR